MTLPALNGKERNDAETFFKSGRGAGGGDCCQDAGWPKTGSKVTALMPGCSVENSPIFMRFRGPAGPKWTFGKVSIGYRDRSAGYARARVLQACGNNSFTQEKTTETERRCDDFSAKLFQGRPAMRAKKRSRSTRGRVDRTVRRRGGAVKSLQLPRCAGSAMIGLGIGMREGWTEGLQLTLQPRGSLRLLFHPRRLTRVACSM